MKIRKNQLPGLFIFCIFLAGTGFINKLSATSINPDSITINKCKDFEVNGIGNSEFWQNTQWINLGLQGKTNSSYQTKVKVLYSETGIYFLFNCEDKKLTSTMKADYLNLWEEDVVEVFLWTDENFPVYFEYELSPSNYELPIIVPNNKGTFLGWLPWHYEGDRKTRHATSTIYENKAKAGNLSCWIAEFFIPYKLLTPLNNVPPASGTRWRANMYRIDYDNGEAQFAWQNTNGSFHEYNKFGTFIFK